MNDRDREIQARLHTANKKYAGKPNDLNYRQNEKRRMATDRVVETGRALLILLGVTLVALLIDGWRRDYGNLSAVLVTHRGTVNLSIKKEGKYVEATPQEGMALDVDSQISTGPNSFATLAFPDGSSMRIESGSSVTIQVLDYFRTGRRDRAFSLGSGSVFVRQSRNAGPLSLLTIGTNDTIVAGKAASAWRVSQQSNITRVAVVGGSAVMRTATGRREVRPGQQADSEGSLSTLPDTRSSRQLSNALSRYEVKPNFWTNTAAGGTRFLDPLLQRIGLTLQGWNPDKTDVTRRNAAYASLKKMATLIGSGEPPDTLNPVALNELGSPDETARLRKDFAGMAIDGYQKIGSNGYSIRIRARDSKGTPYELKNGRISGGN
jgi:hypothetical protein